MRHVPFVLLTSLGAVAVAAETSCQDGDCRTATDNDQSTLMQTVRIRKHIQEKIYEASPFAPPTTDDKLPVLTFQLLDNKTYPEARCLDGSPGAFYFQEAADEEDANNWLIFLEGGGWCFSPEACLNRAEGWLGGSGNFPRECQSKANSQCNFQGLASMNCSISPRFCKWNHVYVKYCDATSFSGTQGFFNDTYGGDQPNYPEPNPTIYFNGKKILEATIDTLLKKYSMQKAEDVLLTGCSAGALGVILNTDAVYEQITADHPLKTYGAAPASGYFMQADNVEGIANYPTSLAASIQMAKWALPSTACGKHFGPLQEWKCRFAQYAYEYVTSPTFLLNSALDWWQTNFIFTKTYLSGTGPSGDGSVPGWEECGSNITKCTEEQLPAMNGFIDNFQNSLSVCRPGNGAFIDVCNWHCEATTDDQGDPWVSFKVDGVKMVDAVTKWWNALKADKLAPAQEHTYIDKCRYEYDAQLGYTPECNPTCTVFKSPFR